MGSGGGDGTGSANGGIGREVRELTATSECADESPEIMATGVTNDPLGLSALELGKNLGLCGFASHLAALAVLGNYVVLRQLVDSENDAAAAALWLACLAYAFRYFRTASRADLLFGGACFGLLVGVKFYALGYAAVALVTLVGWLAWARGIRAALIAAGVWLLAGFCFGGYWYARNLVHTGNPLYPAGSEMTAIYPEISTSSLLGNRSPEVFSLTVQAV